MAYMAVVVSPGMCHQFSSRDGFSQSEGLPHFSTLDIEAEFFAMLFEI
jgi:hypothetical protein